MANEQQVKVPDEIASLEIHCMETCDSLVHENNIPPEDVYFSCLILSTYYEAYSEQGDIRNLKVCEIAWEFSGIISDIVSEREEFSWTNAYFVINSVQHRISARSLPSEQKMDGSISPSHPGSFGENSNENLKNAVNEISELIEAYVNFENGRENDLSETSFLEILLNSIKQRYVQNVELKQEENEVIVDINSKIRDMKEEKDVTNWQIYYGLDLVSEWLEQKVKAENFV